MANRDQDSGNIRVEQSGPPPGSVSAFRLTDEAAQNAAEAVHKAGDAAKAALLPEIPAWVWFAGAAVCGSVAYAAWRALKATAPVLVPMAFGIPPTTAFAMQQAAQRRPPPGAVTQVPITIPGAPLGATLPPETLSAIVALAPALGIPSATASALATIAANATRAAADTIVDSEAAPTLVRSRRASRRTNAASRTMVSAS